ncbi:MAG: RNA polymerase sigma factor [Pseudoxanthomonas sp.]
MSPNAAALIELLIREREALLRFLGRYLDRASTEDTYQSMYFKAADVPGHPPIEDKRAYLYRMAYHHALNQIRGQSRGQKLLDEAQRILADTEMPDVAEVVVAQVELERVARAIRALPEPTRKMFILNRYEGFTQQQIAQRFEVSQTTVEKHIRRALARIRVDALGSGE